VVADGRFGGCGAAETAKNNPEIAGASSARMMN
jgi:hypothetical protein